MKLIKGIFHFIYKVLCVFNLQPALFVCLIGVILFFTGVLNSNSVILLIFQLALILTLVYALIQTISNLLGLTKKIKKSKGAQIVDTGGDSGKISKKPFFTRKKTETNETSDGETEKGGDLIQTETEQPKYFRVKQNPNMIMAEYSDRYELYEIQNGGLKKIRTDYKG